LYICTGLIEEDREEGMVGPGPFFIYIAIIYSFSYLYPHYIVYTYIIYCVYSEANNGIHCVRARHWWKNARGKMRERRPRPPIIDFHMNIP
jgi:hypothetical protein